VRYGQKWQCLSPFFTNCQIDYSFGVVIIGAYLAGNMILVVEDEEAYRDVLARILTKAGYEVLQAADGIEALSLLEKSKIDLVISDILMPRLNGYALVARLRAKWPAMPVILTTGFLSQDAAKNMMSGSVDFIPKPINVETLLDMIHRRISQSS
jgi:DNA-binding NtrC family response regulator